MKRATDLNRAALEAIVDGLQQILYLDSRRPDGSYWDPDRDWGCADACEAAAYLLSKHGLVPEDEEPFVKLPASNEANRFILYDFVADVVVDGRLFANYADAARAADQRDHVMILAVDVPVAGG